MTWVLMVGVLWPTLATPAGVLLGHAIRLDEQRELPNTTAGGNFVSPPGAGSAQLAAKGPEGHRGGRGAGEVIFRSG